MYNQSLHFYGFNHTFGVTFSTNLLFIHYKCLLSQEITFTTKCINIAHHSLTPPEDCNKQHCFKHHNTFTFLHTQLNFEKGGYYFCCFVWVGVLAVAMNIYIICKYFSQYAYKKTNLHFDNFQKFLFLWNSSSTTKVSCLIYTDKNAVVIVLQWNRELSLHTLSIQEESIMWIK